MSRPRLVFRAVTLLGVAGFMGWRAVGTAASARAPGLDPADALLFSRIALLEWVLVGLAIVTAGAALLALRRPQPPARLKLDLERDGDPPGGPPTA